MFRSRTTGSAALLRSMAGAGGNILFNMNLSLHRRAVARHFAAFVARAWASMPPRAFHSPKPPCRMRTFS